MAKTKKRSKQPKYKSKFERETAEFLRTKLIAFQYEPTRLTYMREHTYTPDFKLQNGIFIETKGRFTSSDRTKMLAVKLNHPRLDIRMCFMRDNYLYKGSKTKYSDWCKMHDIKYCIKEIPKAWLKK